MEGKLARCPCCPGNGLTADEGAAHRVRLPVAMWAGTVRHRALAVWFGLSRRKVPVTLWPNGECSSVHMARRGASVLGPSHGCCTV